MAPPKQDAFAHLFNYAHGSSQRSSPSTSLNDLSQKNPGQSQPKASPMDSWANLDILSPNSVLSPAPTKPQTPVAVTGRGNGAFQSSAGQIAPENDPFAFFEPQANTPPQTSDPQPAKSVNTHSFDIFDTNSRAEEASGRNSAQNTASTDDLNSVNSQNGLGNYASFLDEEFTDAFVNSAPEPREFQPQVSSPVPESRKDPVITASDERDYVLAALVSEGFPIDIANKAIDRVGPDFDKCTRLIVMSSVRPEHSRHTASSKDLGGALQGMSNDLYKKASWFLDKSKKTVIKNINNLQNQRARREGNDMPAWIASQHKYKDQAIERKKDGGSYEDYGSDDENIDTDEIRRIVQLQRQKELERQRQRLESLGRSRSTSSSKSNSSQTSASHRPAVDRVSSFQSASQTPKWSSHSETETETGPLSGSSSSASSTRPPKTSINSSTAQKPSNRASGPGRAQPSVQNETIIPPKDPAPEVDLLGLGSVQAPLSRAQRFKNNAREETSYVSPSRRRHTKSSPAISAEATSVPRSATSEPLNTFAQSDYETHKAKGAESFSSGDYDNALNAYTKCLESLPATHELRIVITANLALTAIKIGNYRLAAQNCEQGLALVGEHFGDPDWFISDKNIKYWHVRLLTRKAESLEMLENFPASLECYMFLITKLGVNDKKTMDAKRRVNTIVNPPKSTPKPSSKPVPPKSSNASSSSSLKTTKLDQVKSQHMKEKLQEQEKFQLHDVVNDRVQQWSNGKEDNLRSLLMSLSDVLPQRLGFPFITDKKITINDLMLTKKVKINYMKVISNIHPDKLGGLQLEDQMICQAVFVTLNKAWDQFKIQNNIA